MPLTSPPVGTIMLVLLFQIYNLAMMHVISASTKATALYLRLSSLALLSILLNCSYQLQFRMPVVYVVLAISSALSEEAKARTSYLAKSTMDLCLEFFTRFPRKLLKLSSITYLLMEHYYKR